MAERKSFLLRLDRQLYDDLRRWAAADLRSVNAQIEFILRRWLQQRGGTARDNKMGSDPNPM